MPNLFVYGTLRRPAGGPGSDTLYHDRIAGSILSAQTALLDDAVLFDFGPYPGIARGEGSVVGDLYEIAEATLLEIDLLEGHPDFYERTLEVVRCSDGTTVEAWVYWAPATQTADQEIIPGGDWFNRPVQPFPPVRLPDSASLRSIIDRLSTEPCTWVSTVQPDGRPHSVPMWHVVHGNRIYFCTPSNAVKVSNLEHNPHVVVTLPDPTSVVIVNGWAIEHAAALEAVRRLFFDKYGWDPASEASGSHVILAITPRRITAWTTEFDQTTWEF